MCNGLWRYWILQFGRRVDLLIRRKHNSASSPHLLWPHFARRPSFCFGKDPMQGKKTVTVSDLWVWAALFWDRVEIRGVDECWEWMAGRHCAGYGEVSMLGRPELCHRIALQSSLGAATRGAMACHKCNNRRCCNPCHLYWGNDRTNTDDKILSGGIRTLIPTWVLVQIREACLAGGMTRKEIASKFGVGKSTVQRIATGAARHNLSWIS